MKGIGGHHSYRGSTSEWLTPPQILHDLGPFDLDPAAPINRPWDMAARHYTQREDGLSQQWEGRTWLNPPYGTETGSWLERLVDHGDGIALIFARTETDMFHQWVWDHADALYFFRKRLHFHYPDGNRAKENAGGPSVLIAYGQHNVLALQNYCGLPGKLLLL